MKKIRTIIIEDVDKDYNYLVYLLENNYPEVEILGRAIGIETGKNLIKEQKPDLVFCDIELEEEGTCFDILDNLENENYPINFSIVFSTAYEKLSYTTKILEYFSQAYLKKPFGLEHLAKKMDRITHQISQQVEIEKITYLRAFLKEKKEKSNRILVNLVRNQVRLVDINKILYIEADGVICTFYLENKEEIVAQRNLGTYRKLLELDHNFFSLSHGITVNLDKMKHYRHTDNTLEFLNGDTIKGSRKFSQRFFNHLKDSGQLRLSPPNEDNFLTKIKRILGIDDKPKKEDLPSDADENNEPLDDED